MRIVLLLVLGASVLAACGASADVNAANPVVVSESEPAAPQATTSVAATASTSTAPITTAGSTTEATTTTTTEPEAENGTDIVGRLLSTRDGVLYIDSAAGREEVRYNESDNPSQLVGVAGDRILHVDRDFDTFSTLAWIDANDGRFEPLDFTADVVAYFEETALRSIRVGVTADGTTALVVVEDRRENWGANGASIPRLFAIDTVSGEFRFIPTPDDRYIVGAPVVTSDGANAYVVVSALSEETSGSAIADAIGADFAPSALADRTSSEVIRVRLDGSGFESVELGGSADLVAIGELALSPDDSRLAAILAPIEDDKPGSTTRSIHAIDLGTGDLVDLTAGDVGRYSEIDWSPDGTQLIVEERDNGFSHFILETDGSGDRTSVEVGGYRPIWIP